MPWLALVLLAGAAHAALPVPAPALPTGAADSGRPGAAGISLGASDGSGGSIVVWAEVRRGVSHVFAQRLDAGGARQWPDSGVAVSGAMEDQASPTVVSDGAGGAIVAWVESVPGASAAFAQRLDASGTLRWGPGGVQASNAGASPSYLAGTEDGAGGILLAWDEFVGDRIHAQRVGGDGVPRWAGDVIVCSSASLAIDPDVTADGAGGAIVTWQDRRGTNYDIYAARIDSSGALAWPGNGVLVCGAPDDQWYPAIAPDGAGGAIMAWQDRRSGVYDIYAQHLDGHGSVKWNASGMPVCTATGQQYTPRIVADGSGGGIVAWQDQRVADWRLFAQRVDGQGAARWTLDGVELCMASGGQFAQQLVPDGAGGATVAWEDFRTGHYDIYAQRVDSLGVTQWPAGGAPVCTTAGDQLTPAIASDGAGGVIVSWPDGRVGDADLYAQKLSAAGSPEWTTGGTPVYLTPGLQFAPLIVATGDGGEILVWKQKVIGDYAIVGSRISGAGIPVWPLITLCGAPGVRIPAAAIPDGADGAIVVWQDARDGELDLYAQRVNAAGSVRWAVDGVPVCAAAGSQGAPALATDGAGGVLAAWQDPRAGSADIYAQRVDSTGSPRWAADGLALCSAAGDQRSPQIASDGVGGAIVVWQDGRVAGPFVYAQRVSGAGDPLWTADGQRVATDAAAEWTPSIVSSGGGAIIGWFDSRGHNYAQRVDASGATLWAPVGNPLTTTNRREGAPVATSDGADGAIFTWIANADSNYCPEACPTALFAQKIDAGGALRWPVQYGAPVLTGGYSPGLPLVIPDGAGGEILAFSQFVGGTTDAFVQHVDSAGISRWGSQAEPVGTAPGRRGALALAADAAGGALVAWQESDGYAWRVHSQRFDPLGSRGWPHDGVTSVPSRPGGAAAAGLTLGNVIPNPCRGPFQLRLSLPGSAPATLEMFDVSGRSVLRRSWGGAAPGPQQVSFGDARLAPGVYLVRLRQGGSAVTRTVIVLR